MPESDLEDRLFRDARRAIAAPDLDVALAEARSAGAPAHHNRRAPWLAAAATVVVVAGGATALWGTGASTDGPTHAAPSRPATAGRFVSQITGVVLLPNDPSGRFLWIYATAPGKRMPGGYGCVDSTTLKVGQSSTRVGLRTTARLRSNGTVSCESAGYRDPRTGTYLAGLGFRLDKPLGTRRVVDETTGKAIAVFRPRVPHPEYLPHRYAPQYKRSAIKSTSFWYDERPGFLSPIAAATEYKANGATPRLGIINAPTRTVTAGGRVLEHVQIDGRTATVTDSPYARCVTWSPDGRTGRQVCSYNAIVNPLGDYQKGIVQLGVDQLVKVARSLS